MGSIGEETAQFMTDRKFRNIAVHTNPKHSLHLVESDENRQCIRDRVAIDVNVMTPTGAFGFYVGMNLIAWFTIFCFLCETKQPTLEELDQVFSIPTRKYVSYETTVALPYFIKRNLLRRRIPKPPPLIERAEKVDAVAEA